MQLNRVQEKFKDIVLDHPDAVAQPDTDFARLFSEGNIPLPERLKVYRNNVVGGLTDTIIVSFPVLENLVGRPFLEGMTRSFILKNPPTDGCLNTYGRGFDNFIRTFKPAQKIPYLPDIALFESLMTESYYAPDDAPMTAQDLSAIAPEKLEQIVLKLRHSVHLISSAYPLEKIRDFCLKESRDENEKLDLDEGGSRLMVYRPALEVLLVKLEADEYLFLENIRNRETLGNALENTLQKYPDFQFQIFLQKHLHLETFQTFKANIQS